MVRAKKRTALKPKAAPKRKARVSVATQLRFFASDIASTVKQQGRKLDEAMASIERKLDSTNLRLNVAMGSTGQQLGHIAERIKGVDRAMRVIESHQEAIAGCLAPLLRVGLHRDRNGDAGDANGQVPPIEAPDPMHHSSVDGLHDRPWVSRE
jgi:hypothetical protein